MSAGMVCVPAIVPLKELDGSKKAKVDTNTAIELSTETRNAYIYYTVDGTKPEPFKKYGTRTTYRYTKPFYLNSGKVTVKAIAIADDKVRESSINTKVFQVEEGPAADRRQFEEPENLREQRRNGGYMEERSPRSNRSPNPKDSFRTTFSESSTLDQFHGDHQQRANNSTRLVTKVLNGDIHETSQSHNRSLLFQSPEKNNPNLMMQSPQNCLYCHAPRPSDPYARFCNECGRSIPPVPMGKQSMSSDNNRTRVCQQCHSVIPFNDVQCNICNGRTSHNIDETSIVLCPSCGSTNSVTNVECIVCEAALRGNIEILKADQELLQDPPSPDATSFLVCSKCNRANSANARFCDWCGSKPSPASSAVACLYCKYPNHSYARYCSSCRQVLKPPLRIEFDYDSMGRKGALVTQEGQQSLEGQHNSPPRWIGASKPTLAVTQKSTATQTVGSFYPPRSISAGSSRSFGPLSPGRESPLSVSGSPAKGYWRQQVDYIAKHLKVYTQTDLEFRETVSAAKLGNLLKITAEPSEDLQEFTLGMTFSLLNGKKSFKSKAQSVKTGMTLIKALSNAQKLQVEKLEKEIRSEVEKESRKQRVNRPKSTKRKNKLSSGTKKLFRLVAGQDIDEETSENQIEIILEEGVDMNAENEQGETLLKVALKHGNSSLFAQLIKAGANVNKESGAQKNTVLHEAVLLGQDGIEAVSVLLENNADGDQKNKTGETPYDLALKAKHNDVIAKFTSKYGLDLLKSSIK